MYILNSEYSHTHSLASTRPLPASLLPAALLLLLLLLTPTDKRKQMSCLIHCKRAVATVGERVAESLSYTLSLSASD